MPPKGGDEQYDRVQNIYGEQHHVRRNWYKTVSQQSLSRKSHNVWGRTEVKYAVGLSACTATLHLCVKLAGEKLYGRNVISHGVLEAKRVIAV